MAHQLDFIKKEHILKAIEQIAEQEIPNDNLWSEYWIKHNGELYQFKYLVEIASSFTNTPIETTDFTSNDSSRNYIAKLGFQIIYKANIQVANPTKHWICASYYGPNNNQEDMFEEFYEKKYWRTDHDLSTGEGLKIYNDLKRVNINDRIAVRYLDRKGGTVSIGMVGTISGVNNIEDGRLEVKWDYEAPLYKGQIPSGSGSGNWWRTLMQLNIVSYVELIFGDDIREKRIARLTWNDNGWIMPSGRYGKSSNADTHEGKNGYGHEEWIFDTSKIINGYHYAFLEPIRKEQQAYINRQFEVWLYSINGETKKRYWIGNIKKVIVLDTNEASKLILLMVGFKKWKNK
jgi:hypothetical protein